MKDTAETRATMITKGPKPRPVIYDLLHFPNKPMTGVLGRQSLKLLYEWELTHQPEAGDPSTGDKPSPWTIEHAALRRLAQAQLGFERVVLDIEGLPRGGERLVGPEYLREVKAATGRHVKWCWYNINTLSAENHDANWQNRFKLRDGVAVQRDWIAEQDFMFCSYYFKPGDTLEKFWSRHEPSVQILRLAMAREQELIVNLCPQIPSGPKGGPGNKFWPFVSGDLLTGVIDRFADQGVDGISLWSLQPTAWVDNTWDSAWWGDWHTQLITRIEPATRGHEGWSGGYWK
jgi:hypothetical protein